jgi:hypothetical protein
MDAEWLTHREAAKRLGSNIDAVRPRAIAAAGLELSVMTSAEARSAACRLRSAGGAGSREYSAGD